MAAKEVQFGDSARQAHARRRKRPGRRGQGYPRPQGP